MLLCTKKLLVLARASSDDEKMLNFRNVSFVPPVRRYEGLLILPGDFNFIARVFVYISKYASRRAMSAVAAASEFTNVVMMSAVRRKARKSAAMTLH